MWYKTDDTEWEWRWNEKTLVLRGKHIRSILQMGGMMVERDECPESTSIHEISRHQVKRIVVEEGAESVSLSSFYGSFDQAEEIILPQSLRKIGAWAFKECRSLKKLEIPQGVDSIEEGAFYRCSSLREMIFLDHISRIEDHMFEGCSGIEHIVFPKNVTHIGKSAFAECYGLQEVHLPNTVEEIEDLAFAHCLNVKSIYISERITRIGCGSFAGCCRVEAFAVSDQNPVYRAIKGQLCDKEHRLLQAIVDEKETCYICPEDVTEICDYAFYNLEKSFFGGGMDPCYHGYNFKEIVLPSGLRRIGNYAFAGCHKITEVVIPEEVTEIGDRAFWKCKNLEKVLLPISMEVLGENIFNETRVREVHIPEGVKKIPELTGIMWLDYVKIPLSAEEINSCLRATLIEYEGSRRQWKRIRRTMKGRFNINIGPYYREIRFNKKKC